MRYLRIFSILFFFKIHHRLYRLLVAIVLFFLSLTIGIMGFQLIEGWTLLESFYMAVITMGTVGFQEVHPLSPEGRLFTAFYILLNLGIFAVVVSVITSYLFEGELREIFNHYIIQRKVQKLNNHVIICGFGKNGHRAGEELSKNKIPFVVVEHDAELLKENIVNFERLNHVSYLEGDATQDEILKNAGVERARALITTLPKDADNVFVTLTARQLNPQILIIARANEASAETKLRHAGANRIVRPDLIGGTYMANLVTRPEVVEFLDMIGGTGELKLEEFSYLDFKESFRDKSILDLDVRNKTGAHIIGFKDDIKGFMVNPHPSTLIGTGDIMIVLGTMQQITNFAQYFTYKKITYLGL
jgi:voltage-gated potassium channel